MKRLSFGSGGLALTACAVLAGCAAAQLPGVGPAAPIGHESGLTQLSVQRVAALTMPRYVPRPAHPDRGRSWMRRDETAKKLLYVSDWDTNDVDVYDYPRGKAVGVLTGFDEPYAQCVDKKGDVYISNFGNGEILEYAHGGTEPIKTLYSTGAAIGCSVDKAGDLAVTDFYTSSGGGALCIWKGGSGSPTCYGGSSACYYMWPFGYDDKGNLIGEGEYDTIAECALMAGASSITTLSFDGTIDFPAGTMWDGQYVALGDQEIGGTFQSGMYQSTLSASSLTQAGETILSDDCYSDYSDIVSPFVVGKKNTPVNDRQGSVVVGADLWCADEGKGVVALWHYPAGGDPFKSIAKSPAEPYGQSVSIGK